MELKLTKNKKEKIFEKPNPDQMVHVYWHRILKVFFFLLFLGTAGAVFLFFHMSNVFDSSLSQGQEINSLILNKSNLKEALEFAEEKQKALENAKQNLPDAIDPSSINSYSLEQ